MQPTTRAEREEQRKSASERWKARRLWRREILARVAGGESRVEIATETGVSIRAVQRALTRAAAERPREQTDSMPPCRSNAGAGLCGSPTRASLRATSMASMR
jgi:FixJ family two-component response regulator